jgi:hypothetical protein
MPELQFIWGALIGAVVALTAGILLAGTISPRMKRYVWIALIAAVACLLLNYAGCGGFSGSHQAWKLDGSSTPGRHFTDGCILGAALAFIIHRLWPKR